MSDPAPGPSAAAIATEPQPPPQVVWFPRQHLAFDRAQVLYDQIPPEDQHRVGVWCRDIGISGAKEYAAALDSVFWFHYHGLEPHRRMHYEIIVGMRPCFLFYDVEANRQLNPKMNWARVIDRLIHHTCKTFEQIYGVDGLVLAPSMFLVLDSSNERKASAHIVARPQTDAGLPAAWLDVEALKAFVNHVFVRIQEYEEESLFLVAVQDSVDSQRLLATPVVDTTVYTRNRAFRLFWSSKAVLQAKDARFLHLYPAPSNQVALRLTPAPAPEGESAGDGPTESAEAAASSPSGTGSQASEAASQSTPQTGDGSVSSVSASESLSSPTVPIPDDVAAWEQTIGPERIFLASLIGHVPSTARVLHCEFQEHEMG